jgi:hypothetical protein
MAIQDRLAGTTVNKANVVNSLNSIFAQFANYDQFGVCTLLFTFLPQQPQSSSFVNYSLMMMLCGGLQLLIMDSNPTGYVHHSA